MVWVWGSHWNRYFILTGQEAHNDAGPAIVVSYTASGLSAMLSIFCHIEFAVEIPVAGGSFAYLRVELGDLAAFIAAEGIAIRSYAFNWSVEDACKIPSDNDGRIGRYVASIKKLFLEVEAERKQIAPSVDGAVDLLKNLSMVDQLERLERLGVSRYFKDEIASALEYIYNRCVSPFLKIRAAAIVYFAYTGFDAIATMAEETKNPSKDIPLGLLGSMSAITVIYCLMALSLCLMESYRDIDVDAAYSVAFERVGWNWAKYLVALGALKAMTTVLLVGAVGQARYVTHIARTHMIPPWFALVNEKTGTPINATAVMTLASASVALFSSLDVLSNLLSISTLFIFMMMAIALLVRRHHFKGKTSSVHISLLLCFILAIIGSAIGTTAYWALGSDGWIGYTITIPIYFLATAGLAVFVPQCRKPKVWGVPLVPWLPSLSIFMNIFLMGSLDKESFIRFGICTGVMLLYYLLFGLHASYDVAHLVQQNYEDVVSAPAADQDRLHSILPAADVEEYGNQTNSSHG